MEKASETVKVVLSFLGKIMVLRQIIIKKTLLRLQAQVDWKGLFQTSHMVDQVSLYSNIKLVVLMIS